MTASQPAPAQGQDPSVRLSLDAFFRPRAVALIGATEAEGSVGAALARNLEDFGEGYFPINPRRRAVFGRVCAASIGEVPAAVDLAVIATPAAGVPGVIAECGRAGVRAAIVVSAGFKETGAEGRALEQRVMAEAREHRMRVLGPNCLGLLAPHAGLNASFATRQAAKGNLALISQSGALCTAILDWAAQMRIGFSAFVSTGSMADVGWGDLIDWLGEDPETAAILMYMESAGDGASFLAAARRVAPKKPIIVLKAGRTGAAAGAAASHTGALAGDDEVLDAAFRSAGVLRVAHVEELYDVAELLFSQPLPGGPDVAIVTNAGGPGVLATDALVSSGAALAPLDKGTLAALDALLPGHWSHGNPVDILGDANPQRFEAALRGIAQDGNVRGLLVIVTPQAMTDPVACARALIDVSRGLTIPVMASWMGGADMDEARQALRMARIPTFDDADRAARAFALLWQRQRDLPQMELHGEDALNGTVSEMKRVKAAAIIDHAAAEGVSLLGRQECQKILAAYDLPWLPIITATSETDAVSAASRMGFPVAMKLHSATITHKTEAGGVKLHLRDDAGVRRAWREIRAGVGVHDFLGVTVEPMVDTTEGYELILGSSQKESFGPVLLFGAGGQLVEVVKDYELALPPLTRQQAMRLMARPRIAAALRGVRGRPPVDLDALAGIIMRFGQLVVNEPRIREIEINPLLASHRGFRALDVRIRLAEAAGI